MYNSHTLSKVLNKFLKLCCKLKNLFLENYEISCKKNNIIYNICWMYIVVVG